MSAVSYPLRAASTAEPISVRFHLGYRPWLDGLRGIAILLVFIHHLQHFAFQSNPAILTAGFLGVDVFFVLSGFLITCLLLEEWDTSGSISLPNFYMRRFLRLMPALILFLAGICLYAVIALPPQAATETFWSSLYSLFYATNWINAFRVAPISELLGHTWSLAMEEQFYLVWPLVLLALLRWRVARPVIIALLVTLITIICVHRIALVDSGAWVHRTYSAPDTRADSLLIGCLAAMLVSWNLIPTSRAFLRGLRAASFASVLIVIAYLRNLGDVAPDMTLRGFGFSVFGIAVAVLLIQSTLDQHRLAGSVLESRGLVWLGRVSYGIYLWHLPICIIVASLSLPAWLRVVTIIALSIALASASYYVVERSFLQLKKRFSYA